jgi:hypothetical protein
VTAIPELGSDAHDTSLDPARARGRIRALAG